VVPVNRSSRGIREVARQAVTSPIRLSRREVAVPFRVLLSNGVAGLLGCLLPVWSWRSLNARAFPVFLPLLLPKEATPWTILSWGSVLLHGMSRNPCPRCLHLGHLSWGFLPLQRIRRRESTSRPVARPSSPGFHPGIRQQVPPCQLRCRPQVFSTSRRLLPPSAVLPFSGRWRSWGSPFRGSCLSRSPGSSSPPACPLDFPPAGRASPVLGGGASRRERRFLGSSGATPFFVFRASVRARIGPRH
jgi:hypothetical protein